jgi:hypothetical protein
LPSGVLEVDRSRRHPGQHNRLVCRATGEGTTFHYTITRLTKLAQKVEQRGVTVEGWIHFCVNGVHEKEMGATVYRLTVLTPNGGISTDIAGTKNLAGLEGRQFQKIPYASHAFHH